MVSLRPKHNQQITSCYTQLTNSPTKYGLCARMKDNQPCIRAPPIQMLDHTPRSHLHARYTVYLQKVSTFGYVRDQLMIVEMCKKRSQHRADFTAWLSSHERPTAPLSCEHFRRRRVCRKGTQRTSFVVRPCDTSLACGSILSKAREV